MIHLVPLLGFVRTRRGFREDSYLKLGLQMRYVAGRCSVKAWRGYIKVGETVLEAVGQKQGYGGRLTLMKPPSGFARLKRGCLVFLGCSSAGDLIFLNSGTVFIMGGLGRRAALESLKEPSRVATADEG